MLLLLNRAVTSSPTDPRFVASFTSFARDQPHRTLSVLLSTASLDIQQASLVVQLFGLAPQLATLPAADQDGDSEVCTLLRRKLWNSAHLPSARIDALLLLISKRVQPSREPPPAAVIMSETALSNAFGRSTSLLPSGSKSGQGSPDKAIGHGDDGDGAVEADTDEVEDDLSGGGGDDAGSDDDDDCGSAPGTAFVRERHGTQICGSALIDFDDAGTQDDASSQTAALACNVPPLIDEQLVQCFLCNHARMRAFVSGTAAPCIGSALTVGYAGSICVAEASYLSFCKTGPFPPPSFSIIVDENGG